MNHDAITENPEWHILTDWKVERLIELGSVRKNMSKALVSKTRRAIRIADVEATYRGLRLGQSRLDKARYAVKTENRALKRALKKLINS